MVHSMHHVVVDWEGHWGWCVASRGGPVRNNGTKSGAQADPVTQAASARVAGADSHRPGLRLRRPAVRQPTRVRRPAGSSARSSRDPPRCRRSSPAGSPRGVEDPGRLAEYGRRDPTHREHAGEIQREYGYRDFSDASAQAELLGWLGARAWATAERPSVLFDLATARLIEGKVLLPGASVLARAVTAARDRAAARLHRSLSEAAAAYRE